MFDLLGLKIYGYGLLIGIGSWLAWEIALRVARNQKISSSVIDEGVMWVIIGAVIGARIYHVADFWGRFYSHNLLDILFIWRGGLGIWGAIIGGCLSAFIYTKLKRFDLLRFLDILAVGVPVAQAVGRLGNWVNHEIVGKNGEPLFAYEAVLSLLLFTLLWKKSKSKYKKGSITGMYLIGYGVIRFFLENLRPDNIIWKWQGMPVAVIVSGISIVLGSTILLLTKREKAADK